MNDIPNLLHADLRRGFKLENAVGFFGPVVVIRHQVRDEAARFAQSLRIGETVVGPPELVFSSFTVLDIDIDSIPLDDFPRFVSQRVGAKQEPAIGAVETAKARFDLSGFASSQN